MKLLNESRALLEKYFKENNLSLKKLKNTYVCGDSDAVAFVYPSDEDDGLGISVSDVPLPPILWIKRVYGLIKIEETPLTRQYLSL